MKQFLISLALVALSLSIGCTSSVYPLGGKPVTNSNLAGTWTRANKRQAGPDTITIERNASNFRGTYPSTRTKENKFELQLTRIGAQTYINAKVIADDDPPSLEPRHELALNYFARVEIERDQIRLFLIDEPNAHSFFRQHGIEFIDNQNFLILTSPSRRLQSLVEKHHKTMFVETPIIYRRTDSRRQIPNRRKQPKSKATIE